MAKEIKFKNREEAKKAAIKYAEKKLKSVILYNELKEEQVPILQFMVSNNTTFDLIDPAAKIFFKESKQWKFSKAIEEQESHIKDMTDQLKKLKAEEIEDGIAKELEPKMILTCKFDKE